MPRGQKWLGDCSRNSSREGSCKQENRVMSGCRGWGRITRALRGHGKNLLILRATGCCWKALSTIITLSAPYFHVLFKNQLLIYFWLHWVFAAAHGLSPVADSRGYSLAMVGTGSRAHSGSVSVMGLDAPLHMESSWTSDQTHVHCKTDS